MSYWTARLLRPAMVSIRALIGRPAASVRALLPLYVEDDVARSLVIGRAP